MRKGSASPGRHWEIFLPDKSKFFFQNSFDCYVQRSLEFLIYARLPCPNGVSQLYVVDSLAFQAHCLLALSFAIFHVQVCFKFVESSKFIFSQVTQ